MRPPLPMHRDVATVEATFEAAGGPGRNARELRLPKPTAEHAIWLSPCMAADEYDTPSWLLWTEADQTFAWCRIPDRLGDEDLVRARHIKGGHTDIEGVLGWLQGAYPEPWSPEHSWASGRRPPH